jgi:hypothetical protein
MHAPRNEAGRYQLRPLCATSFNNSSIGKSAPFSGLLKERNLPKGLGCQQCTENGAAFDSPKTEIDAKQFGPMGDICARN